MKKPVASGAKAAAAKKKAGPITLSHAPAKAATPVSATQKAALHKKRVAAAKKAAATRASKKRRYSPDTDVACCSARAVAQSLLLAVGVRTDDADVLSLYWATGAHTDDGATILDTLRAAAARSLSGYRPRWRPAGEQDLGRTVLIAGLQLEHDTHAVAVDRYLRCWSWGQPHGGGDFAGADIEECWAVTWCAG